MTINLICNKYWYGLLKDNKIDFDYRPITEHYTRMLVGKKIDKIVFRLGYTKTVLEREVEDIFVGGIKGYEGRYYIIKLKK